MQRYAVLFIPNSHVFAYVSLMLRSRVADASLMFPYPTTYSVSNLGVLSECVAGQAAVRRLVLYLCQRCEQLG